MKVLFIASDHLSLYKIIEQELKRQGNEVETIIDDFNRFDPGIEKKSVRYYVKYVLWQITLKLYWRKQILRNPALCKRFDCLLVLSGVSVIKYIVDYLNKNNPNIKKILYTWDSCNFYPFNRLLPFFDKSYSFDIDDANRDSRWRLLPIFYFDSCQLEGNKSEYDLFSVGTNHGDRYSFIKKVLPQLKENEIKYYIKIVSKEIVISKKRIFFNLIFGGNDNNPECKEAYNFSIGKENIELLARNPISQNEYTHYISRSNCVLDDQRDGQSGLSARFIWALANKKKIVTTNQKAIEYPFVNPNQVYIIDKTHPVIPVQFIKEPLSCHDVSNVSFIRIDNWIKELLS